jgi:hypothetical protein
MKTDTNDTPRTDEQIWTTFHHHENCDVVDMVFARQLERELAEKTNEVARLRELLEKALFELEKVPFQNPKLTAFTAHRLADRYREKLNQLTK